MIASLVKNFLPHAQEQYLDLEPLSEYEKEARPLDRLDVPNIDPGRLLDLHDAMLSHVQSDERARKAWQQSNSVDQQRRQAELREEWRVFYLRLSQLHRALSEENRSKAAALGTPSRNGSGGP